MKITFTYCLCLEILPFPLPCVNKLGKYFNRRHFEIFLFFLFSFFCVVVVAFFSLQKFQNLFSTKNKNNIINLSSVEFFYRVVKVKE